MSYTVKDDYLRKYEEDYRVKRSMDGIWELPLRWKKDEFGLEYACYPFSDTHLAALLPHKAGLSINRRFPGVFRIHQEAIDGTVLVFEEGRLDEVAKAIRLRRRRKGPEATPEILERLTQGRKKGLPHLLARNSAQDTAI